MDQDLISYLERFREEILHKLEQVDDRLGRVEGRLEKVEARLERVEENVRHVGIEVEGLHDEVKLVAEAYIGLDERLTALRVDLVNELSKVQSSIRQPFEYLDSRLRVIEVRADNVTRDALDLIRERLGKAAPPEDPP